MNKLQWVTLALFLLSNHAFPMEQGVVNQLQQFSVSNQQKGIYCPTCMADSKANKPLNNSCPDCIRFKTNDGKTFRFALDMVPEHWKTVQSMTAKQEEGHVTLQDLNSADLAFFVPYMLVKNKNDLLNKLQFPIEQIKEEQNALILSLQDPQIILDLMEKTLMWSADPKEISPLAERFVLLVKDVDFDVAEFAKTEGINPTIISAVVSWLKILNKNFVIPNDSKGSPVKINILLKDWAKHNRDVLKSRIKKNLNGSLGIDLTKLNLSDITGCMDVLKEHAGDQIKDNKLVIDLYDNNISSLASGVFSNCPELIEVRLSFNQISSIAAGAFSNCPQLQDVDLSHNQISSLPVDVFSNCTELKWVWLVYNQLSSLGSGLFSNYQELMLVDLSYNQIRWLGTAVFKNCPMLKVDLKNNYITSVKADEFVNCPYITNNWEDFQKLVNDQRKN